MHQECFFSVARAVVLFVVRVSGRWKHEILQDRISKSSPFSASSGSKWGMGVECGLPIAKGVNQHTPAASTLSLPILINCKRSTLDGFTDEGKAVMRLTQQQAPVLLFHVVPCSNGVPLLLLHMASSSKGVLVHVFHVVPCSSGVPVLLFHVGACSMFPVHNGVSVPLFHVVPCSNGVPRWRHPPVAATN